MPRTDARDNRVGLGAGRVLAAAGAAIALVAAASAVGAPTAQDDKGMHRQETIRRDTSTIYYTTNDPAWTDGESYGEVNYPEDMDYGDFVYYSDYPPGSDKPARRTTAQQVSQTQTVQYSERYPSDYDSRVHRAGMYEQTSVHTRGQLPQTSVVIHDMNIRSDQAPGTARTARYEEPVRTREQVQTREQVTYRPAAETRQAVTRKTGLSYGDVNYEEDPGYGEFSYYGDEEGLSRRYGDTTRSGTTPVRYQQTPARNGGTYYTDDWENGRSDFDRWYEQSR